MSYQNEPRRSHDGVRFWFGGRQSYRRTNRTAPALSYDRSTAIRSARGSGVN